MKLNIPNQLTLLRVLLIPVFMVCMLYIPNPVVCGFVSAATFGLTALTDMLDGKIARRYNLITNFGKFLDPLADKLMVFSALLILTVKANGVLQQLLIWATVIVFLRELAVTAMRLVCVYTEAGVIAAMWLGKCKTVAQIATILVLILEPVFCILTGIDTKSIASYVMVAFMTFMVIWAGIDYLKRYWKYINPSV